MKNKYIDIIFIGILSCILMSLFFLSPTLIHKTYVQERNPSESQVFIENDDSSNESINDYKSNIPTEVPYTDKDLLEYLYDNNIITKAQFEQILDLIDSEE